MLSRLGLKTGMVGILAAAAITAGTSVPVGAQDEAPQYIGAESCAKLCHKSAKQGEQLRLWQESKHAGAYATLATDASKAIAKKMGIADAQKAEACLKCHLTGAGLSAEHFDKKFVVEEEGVGCEACHGPGSLYKKRSVMKDREKAVAAGLLVPNEATCTACHNEESPTYKAFNYEERLAEIAHPIPGKE